MSKEDIDITDVTRILFGEVPAEFFIEVLIRLVFIFILALIAMRLMGKRMAAQLSRNELASLVALAAAIGVSVQDPERGLLPSVVIALVIVLVSRFISFMAYRKRGFEKISQGEVSILIENAMLQLQTMEKEKISKEKIFAVLRSKELKNLGGVKRLYMEAGGDFSLVKQNPPKPGLTLVPEWDHDLLKEQEQADHLKVCGSCGYLQEGNFNKEQSCPHCKKKEWTNAVKDTNTNYYERIYR